MSYWLLRADDLAFGLHAGDVLAGAPYAFNPGSPGNPEGKVLIDERVRDGYRPECTQYWCDLERLHADDGRVRAALAERGRPVDQPQDHKPSLTVLAATPSIAQREIARLHLDEVFHCHYVSRPESLRGTRRFIVLPGFTDRPMDATEAARWAEALRGLRSDPHVLEYVYTDIAG